MFSLVQNAIVIFLITCHTNWALEYEECIDVNKPDTFVSSKRSCSKYIFCDGENSFEGECLGGNYFNEIESTCDDPENVHCNIVENESVSSIFEEKFNKSSVVVNNSTGAQEEKVPIVGVIQENPQIDDGDYNVAAEETNVETSVILGTGLLKCPTLYGLENIHHIPHSESCSAFFTCYNGIAIPMLCPRNLFFNAETETCETEIPKNCKLRFSVRLNCRKGVIDYMPHPQRCEYYHYCINGYLMTMRCPYDYTWHYERQTCVQKSRSKCYVESAILAQQPIIYR